MEFQETGPRTPAEAVLREPPPKKMGAIELPPSAPQRLAAPALAQHRNPPSRSHYPYGRRRCQPPGTGHPGKWLTLPLDTLREILYSSRVSDAFATIARTTAHNWPGGNNAANHKDH